MSRRLLRLIRLIIAVAIVMTLCIAGVDARIQSAEGQESEELEPEPRPTSTWALDAPILLIDNYRRDRGDFTAGVRVATPLWYSSLWWRFQLGLRIFGQANISPRFTTHTNLGLQAGLRVLFFSFWSIEAYIGPRVGFQTGSEGSVGTSGMGTTIAYLFHPWSDNRQRLRLGVEWGRLSPMVLGDAPRLRHRGIFFGFEVSF